MNLKLAFTATGYWSLRLDRTATTPTGIALTITLTVLRTLRAASRRIPAGLGQRRRSGKDTFTTTQGLVSFLRLLRSDKRGNTLLLVAFAIIPLLAMIGSGLDMARAYVARDRLQQACDAASLASRRLLSGAVLTPAVSAEATNYFNFNFPQGSFQTAAFTPTVSVPAVGTVSITAATTIPTTIMKLFGFSRLPISSTCSATQDFVGTDIVLVLDMSGSMNCAPGVAGSCNEVEQSGSKMKALRDASKSLYDTLKSAQDQLHANNLRLRYGFVPYNHTVNVGYQVNASHIRNSAPYQSRERTAGPATSDENTCNAFEGSWSRLDRRGNGTCTNYFTYKQLTLNTSDFKTGASVFTPGASSSNSKSTWAGCIEERQTNNILIDGGTTVKTAPADAWDLDVNMIPSSDASRWAPMWPEVEYDPDTRSLYPAARYCASQASRLKEYYNNESGFDSYVDRLDPVGGTYHDIGVIWGARFISPDGIFASATPETNDPADPDNPQKLRGFSIRKYMIFMTDGDMSPYLNIYTTYGTEERDKRVLGSANGATAQLARHLQRFRMACNAAKSQNIKLYVIAFSTTLTDDMKNCASDPSMASGISTSAALITKFQEIGSKIGSLRISR
ncbi:TadE/TadG family type IV pilus assembly protein [Sphingomonas qilianensis]|uniref:TadE/TadG family type IV pilus assembly protein n=1 Tax=Sphingomonas qilianensis TaxID=1736690 RepID=A0ABU9XRW9_9SPHN